MLYSFLPDDEGNHHLLCVGARATRGECNDAVDSCQVASTARSSLQGGLHVGAAVLHPIDVEDILEPTGKIQAAVYRIDTRAVASAEPAVR